MMSSSRLRACSILRESLMTDGRDVLARDRLDGLKLVAVHQVDPDFYFCGCRPKASDFTRYARKLRRRFERSGEVARFVGVIEPSLNVRNRHSAVQLGVHGVIAVRADDVSAARKIAKRVCSAKSDRNANILRPLRVEELCKEKGGLRGALGYAAKSLEVGGVCRRSSYRDKAGHWQARDLDLRAAEQRDVDRIFETVPPRQQVVLFGLRRVKGRLTSVKKRVRSVY